MQCQPQGFLAQLAFSGAVILGVRSRLPELLSDWDNLLKMIVAFLIMGAVALAAALMATSAVVSTGYTRTVLSVCTRFCTCLAAFVLVVDLSFLMESHAHTTGFIVGALAVLFLVSIWVHGDPTAFRVCVRVVNDIKHTWQSFSWSRQRGPILPT